MCLVHLINIDIKYGTVLLKLMLFEIILIYSSDWLDLFLPCPSAVSHAKVPRKKKSHAKKSLYFYQKKLRVKFVYRKIRLHISKPIAGISLTFNSHDTMIHKIA